MMKRSERVPMNNVIPLSFLLRMGWFRMNIS
jgi:hypothetical protein